jgi:hypothetical protein
MAVFPRCDGLPWRSHDWRNWTRRVWHAPGAGIRSLPPMSAGRSRRGMSWFAGTARPGSPGNTTIFSGSQPGRRG